MGKIRNKSHDESRYYKGIIRDLQKQIKQLQRQLKYYTKREHILNDNQDEINEILLKKQEPVPESVKLKCTECKIGHYEEFMVLDRLYGTCTHCGSRKRLV